MESENSNFINLVTNNNMNIIILFGLIFLGIFIKLFLGNNISANSGQASSTVWGYGLTAISLFTVMFVIISISSSDNKSINEMIKLAGLPIFSLVVVFIYIIAINLSYFNILNNNYIPTEYNTYSVISSILIIFQLIMLFDYARIKVNNNEKLQDRASRIIKVTWLFSSLNFILAIIMNIILKYFTTDG